MTDPASTAPASRKCVYCGSIHANRCPQVKAFEYHQDGTVKRVEFFGPRDYPLLGESSLRLGPNVA